MAGLVSRQCESVILHGDQLVHLSLVINMDW